MKKIFVFFIFFAVFINICRASYFVETDTVDIVRYYGEGFEPSGYDVASGDSVITYSGTFKFKKLNSNDSITSIVDFQYINAESQLCSVIISGDKKLMTKQNTVISLSAISDDPMDFYKWYALDDTDNLIDGKTLDNFIKVTVLPNDTAIYILETMKEEEDNLFYNGNFEEGNKGFWTHNDIDSLVTLNLTVNPVYEIHLDTTICDGDYFIFNGQTISKQGDYKSVLKTEKDCDSVVYISVNVIATQKVSI